jgi:hypothetical protein
MHVTIEFQKPAASRWETLGNFTASEKELTELQELLEGREDPFEVLDCITNRLIFDTLDILRSDGYRARVRFHEDT